VAGGVGDRSASAKVVGADVAQACAAWVTDAHVPGVAGLTPGASSPAAIMQVLNALHARGAVTGGGAFRTCMIAVLWVLAPP
jgi:hypothetical protein